MVTRKRPNGQDSWHAMSPFSFGPFEVIVYIRGRKKADAKPAPPARDPRDVETIERLQQRIQELKLQQLQPDSPAEENETEPNFWDDELVDVNLFNGKNIEVINEFDTLRMRCDVVEEEKQVVARFLGVLKPEILILNTVKVSKRCRVQFSIGKSYKDEVWCEVIQMDAAHILLGHPWQFDRKTKHDEFQNTYSFKKNDVNITLVPFDSRQTQPEGSNLFMKKIGFEKLMKTSPYVFTLVVVEENKIISEAPLQVHPLLREFADVIHDDIPPGLPAMRDIQQCVNFILCSAISDKPSYRMNLKEFAELQR
nr:Asp_protease_2 domain-containing protein [Tanacetum cinerariifolium]